MSWLIWSSLFDIFNTATSHWYLELNMKSVCHHMPPVNAQYMDYYIYFYVIFTFPYSYGFSRFAHCICLSPGYLHHIYMHTMVIKKPEKLLVWVQWNQIYDKGLRSDFLGYMVRTKLGFNLGIVTREKRTYSIQKTLKLQILLQAQYWIFWVQSILIHTDNKKQRINKNRIREIWDTLEFVSLWRFIF